MSRMLRDFPGYFGQKFAGNHRLDKAGSTGGNSDTMHISFLLHNAYGIGGTIRTTFTLARTLAEQHDVEIVSVFRHRDAPVLGAPEGVTLRHLVDLRKKSATYDGGEAEHARPASVFPRGDSRHKQYSRLTDARIAAHLQAVEVDVVVGTRPGLNVHLEAGRPAADRCASGRST